MVEEANKRERERSVFIFFSFSFFAATAAAAACNTKGLLRTKKEQTQTEENNWRGEYKCTVSCACKWGGGTRLRRKTKKRTRMVVMGSVD